MDRGQDPLATPQPYLCNSCRDKIAHTIDECYGNQITRRLSEATSLMRREYRGLPQLTISHIFDYLTPVLAMFKDDRSNKHLPPDAVSDVWQKLMDIPWTISQAAAYRAPFVARLWELLRDILVEIATINRKLIFDAAMSPEEGSNPYVFLIALGVARVAGNLPCSPSGETANRVFDRRIGGRLFPNIKRRCPRSNEVWSACMRFNHTSLFLFNLVNETPFAAGETIDSLLSITREEAVPRPFLPSRPVLPEMYRYLQRDGRCVFCTVPHPLAVDDVCQYESLCRLIFVGDVPGVVAMLNDNPQLSLQHAVCGDPLWLAVREGQEAIYPNLDIPPRAPRGAQRRYYDLAQYPAFDLLPIHFAPDVPMVSALLSTGQYDLPTIFPRTQVMQDVAFASGRVSEMLGLYDLVMRADPRMFLQGLQRADIGRADVEMVIDELQYLLSRCSGRIYKPPVEAGQLGVSVIRLMLESARDMLRPVWSTSPRFATTHRSSVVAKARLLVWLFAKLREDGRASPSIDVIPMICMYLDPDLRNTRQGLQRIPRATEQDHPLNSVENLVGW